MLSRAEGRRAFFFTPVVSCVSEFGERYSFIDDMLLKDVVFVAADGGFFCKACVSSPCNEMVEATFIGKNYVATDEMRQWCIVGCQEPEPGHGDVCDHCGKPTIIRDNDDWIDPWPKLDKLHHGSPRLDPRWYGGDRDGPSDCDGEDA